tara:strand:- start:1424 stop:1603 length:180 start_codon:yes stop_codon:yes gene_type:complete
MARPNKIKEPTITYNVNLQVRNYDKLKAMAFKKSVDANQQVAVADLIRTAVDNFIEAHA